jgi:hypothetical protein
MTTEQLDAVHKALPFQPFTLYLADGTKNDVTHPELMWRTPGGRTIIVSGGGEQMTIIDLLLVMKISKGHATNGKRRRG